MLRFIQKNMESWIHYAKGRCHFPWLINATNIRAADLHFSRSYPPIDIVHIRSGLPKDCARDTNCFWIHQLLLEDSSIMLYPTNFAV